jgi:hypothetical protein
MIGFNFGIPITDPVKTFASSFLVFTAFFARLGSLFIPATAPTHVIIPFIGFVALASANVHLFLAPEIGLML